MPAPHSAAPGPPPNLIAPPPPRNLGRFVAESFETLLLAQIFNQQVGTTASLDATHTKFGVQALKIHKTGSASASILNTPGALGRILVGRYWMWLGTNPSVSTTIMQAQTGLSGVMNVSAAGIAAGGFSGVTASSGITVSDSNWHSFDFRLDTRGSTWLYDWMVDSIAQTQQTHAASGTEVISQFAFDKVGASTIDYWIDGWQLSDDWGAYPLDDSPFAGGTTQTDAGIIPVTITMSGTDDGLTSTDSGTIPITIALSGVEDWAVQSDAGTIPVTISLSGSDFLTSFDSGTIPITVVLSGTDQLQSTDAGAIPITIALSGTDQLSSTDAGTIPVTITMSGVEQWGPAPVGQAFHDYSMPDKRHPNRVLPIT
jgi:hypothetical protein